jgi:hypothetical protein
MPLLKRVENRCSIKKNTDKSNKFIILAFLII